MARTRLALVSAVALVGLALLWGCGEEESKIVTPEAAIKVTVTATPNSLETGSKASVTLTLETELAGPFSYAWKAAEGSFSNASAESTGWIAPDVAGLYAISVVVTDGKDVGIGSANVAVGQYASTDSPYYMGASCTVMCHNGGMAGQQYAPWSASLHAHAMEPLAAIGQQENASCLPCHTVGSKGLNADPALHNGGYDEIAVPRLAGVQCENCHGPASDHALNQAALHDTLSAALCSACHQGAHHPTGAEWDSSGHAQVITSPATRAGCAKCHNGLYAADFLNDPESFRDPGSDPTEALPITCAVCHDPHGNNNPSSLRNASVTDRSLPNQVLVEAAGAGRLCMACHNGRRTRTDIDGQIQNGSSRGIGPHHSVQGDMLAGVNAYQLINESFPWSSSRHILAEDACVTCHTHPHEGDPEGSGEPNYTGHRFAPTVQACQQCHGVLNDFDEVMAKQDFDGDGTIEGVQVEVQGLLDRLRQTIIDASATPEARAALEENFEGKLGDATVSTVDQRKAGYNLAYVSFDGSKGVHNTTYAVQLLQQSILFLNPGALPAGAHILRGDE
jgi:hypothetical protein